jgi:hypothetical protein
MPRLHDDLLITPALLKRFVAEGYGEDGDGQHYGFVQRSNGDLCGHHPGSPQIIAEQTMWAADMLKRLNRELHHDGAWTVVFTHPAPPAEGSMIFAQPGHCEYRRYVLLWLDQDGDVQIPIEWIKGEGEMVDFPDVLMAGLDNLVGQCEGAWELWHIHMRQILEPREGETFKRAQGQQAGSTRH